MNCRVMTEIGNLEDAEIKSIYPVSFAPENDPLPLERLTGYEVLSSLLEHNGQHGDSSCGGLLCNLSHRLLFDRDRQEEAFDVSIYCACTFVLFAYICGSDNLLQRTFAAWMRHTGTNRLWLR